MATTLKNSTFEKFFLAYIGTVSICTTPYVVFDPINLPRLVVVTVGGLILGSMFFSKEIFQKQIKQKAFTILLSLMSFDLVVLLIFSGTNFSRSLYGTAGRNTGFIFYAMMAVILVMAAHISSDIFISKVEWICIILGIATSIYGILQHFSLDPINWQNKYGPEVGFFGNVDFQSGFLGIISIIIASFLIRERRNSQRRILGFLTLLFNLVAMNFTGASQGFFILAIGLITMFYFFSYVRFRKQFYILSSLLISVILLFIIEIITNIRIFKLDFLDSNLEVRNQFWQSGVNMTKQNPFLGVGFDGYIDWYRRARPITALTDQFSTVYADAAHNIFLDISSSGGIPLLTLYLGIQFLAFKSIFNVLKREKVLNVGFMGLAAAWFGYQGFALVSISQIGVAVWGWLLTGLLIGYEYRTRPAENLSNPSVESRKLESKVHANKPTFNPNSSFVFLAIAVAMTLSIPPYLASANFVSALKQSDATKLIKAAEAWPEDAQRLGGTISLLAQNKYEKEAALLAAKAVKRFPDSSFIWEIYSQIPGISKKELSLAKSQLRRLDPNNQRLRN